jgi:hypothetical protein
MMETNGGKMVDVTEGKRYELRINWECCRRGSLGTACGQGDTNLLSKHQRESLLESFTF